MKSLRVKVVHIATYVNGGAGTAAYRIHEALLENNVASTFLSLDLPSNKSARACIQFQGEEKSWLRKAIDKFISVGVNRFNLKVSENLYYQKKLRKLTPSMLYEWISLPFTTTDILKNDAVKEADIIHLHWVSGILDYSSFFKNNVTPVVWTLHDMNPFQGLFHYKEDKVRNSKSAKNVDDEIFKIKRRYVRKRKFPLSIVSPSKWLLKAANESSMFDGVPSTNIGYALNTSIFSPVANNSLKDELKIPENNIVFLFVTQLVDNHRKGFTLLIEALKQLKQTNISLLVIGHATDLQISGLHVLRLGSISSTELLTKYYSLADAFIIPSSEDNMPNVMIEAMACGTPVLSFDTGGMAEVIEDGLNGLKAAEISASSLKDVLEEFIARKDEFDYRLIRNYSLQHFSNNVIAEKYIKIYNDLLNDKKINPNNNLLVNKHFD